MFWEGDILFDHQLLAYQGRVADNSMHAHASLQITVSTNGMVELLDESGYVHSGKVLYTRPGTPHQLLAHDRALLLLIEPQSSLAQKMSEGFGIDNIGQVCGSYRELLEANLNLKDLVTEFGSLTDTTSLDPRLSIALDYLAEAPLKNAIRNAAARSGLSESRLRAISQEQLGVPLSKFLLWRAIGRAGRALIAGSSLADSAMAGGFSDQAHYTRTMKKLMGITPGKARKPMT